MNKLLQNVAALLLALVLAGAALGIPAWAARREERALLTAARPRPALGGILWQEPVRQNPVLYALHRTALQGSTPAFAYPYAAQGADPAAAAAAAAPLLETLHEAGVVDDALLAELAPLLKTLREAVVVDGELPAEYAPLPAAPANAWRSADGGRFAALRLSLPGEQWAVETSLDLIWHTESGLPVAFAANVPGADLSRLDLPAMAQAYRSLLGLDALGDWTEKDRGEDYLVCTSAAGQVRLTVSASSGYMSVELAAED